MAGAYDCVMLFTDLEPDDLVAIKMIAPMLEKCAAELGERKGHVDAQRPAPRPRGRTKLAAPV